MAFWGVEVKPGKPFTHRVSDARRRLHVSQATLGVGNAAKKSIVQCNVGDKSPVFLCSLSPDKAESCQLNLEFEEAVEVIFSVIGPRSVHLTGYYLNGNKNFIVNDDSSETYGEDIQDTDAERSISENDYDYSDSFIDDGDPKAYQNSSVSDSDDELTLKEKVDKKKDKKGNGARGRLRKKYQVSDSDADENWKLGAFSGADDSTSDSLELHDTKNEHEVQKFPSSKSTLSSRNKISEARERSSSGMGGIDFNSKKTSGGEDHNACEVTNERLKSTLNCQAVGCNQHAETILPEKLGVKLFVGLLNRDIKSSGSILPSLDKEGHEALLKKKRKKERQRRTVGGQQNSSDGAPNDKQAIDKGVKLSGDILLSSTKEGCEILSKKKRKKKEHEGTVEVSSVEGGKDQQNLSEVTRNEKQATNKGIKLSGNILASSEDGCGTPLKKKRKKEGQVGSIDVSSCIERDNVQENLSEHTENGKQPIDKSGANKPSELETISNGLMMEELDKGNSGGKSAAKGKKVSIIYTGKLKENGQVFDSNVGKDPLRFRLGRGKVIEGLDIGIEGMQVGDKKRFIIPPSLGTAKEGPIENVPVNSWLVYDVEVVKVR